MNRMKITDRRIVDRPRERLLAADHGMLNDAELLAVLLRTGQADCDALELGYHLLAAYGSVRGLLDAPVADLLKRPGLGPTRVASLKVVMPITARYVASRLKEPRSFPGTKEATMFVMAEYAGLEREIFGCLFLDARHRLLSFDKLFFGSVDRANVFPREVAKAALDCNAAAVIFAHNHPSGMAEPSLTDIELTKRLVHILQELDVRVLDHLVVGHDGAVSMAERGYL